MGEPKSIKKLKNTLFVEVAYSEEHLKKTSFYNLKIKAYFPQTPGHLETRSEKLGPLPLHLK